MNKSSSANMNRPVEGEGEGGEGGQGEVRGQLPQLEEEGGEEETD